MQIDKLPAFLVKAKVATYAGDGAEVEPERPGFKELEYKEGPWTYRDSYTGFFCAPGQEIVRYDGTPAWHMCYSGGMRKCFRDDEQFAKQTFTFLKGALERVSEDMPYRGPELHEDGDWKYTNEVDGDIDEFNGTEIISYKDEEVFRQDYFGGIILHKNPDAQAQ